MYRCTHIYMIYVRMDITCAVFLSRRKKNMNVGETSSSFGEVSSHRQRKTLSNSRIAMKSCSMSTHQTLTFRSPIHATSYETYVKSLISMKYLLLCVSRYQTNVLNQMDRKVSPVNCTSSHTIFSFEKKKQTKRYVSQRKSSRNFFERKKVS